MVELTQYQVDAILAWLSLLIWLVVLGIAAYRFIVNGFRKYPWPEWATRRPRRDEGDLDAATEGKF